jgi:hypothetical protein
MDFENNKEKRLGNFITNIGRHLPVDLVVEIDIIIDHGSKKHGNKPIAPLEVHLQHAVDHCAEYINDPGSVEKESGQYQLSHVATRLLTALYVVCGEYNEHFNR